MKTKICSKCKLEIDIDEFYIKKNGKHDSWCWPCRRHKRDYTKHFTKICRTCNEIKTTTNFEKSVTCKDGYRNECKDCRKLKKVKYTTNNKEKIRNTKRLYTINNKEKLKIRKKEYNSSYTLFTSVYTDKLTIEEAPRLSYDGSSLEVKCKYCGDYFKPTNLQIIKRTNSIIGKSTGDCSLYCSNNCKKSCGTFGKVLYPEGFSINTSREVQPELRKLVLARDGYKCQICFKTNKQVELHCHHYEGVFINPIESADIDNCVTLCKKHHNEAHKQDGCSMKREPCK